MPQTYDIAVLGATAAGCAAAYYLAKKKCDVVLIDAPSQGAECPQADWVGAEFFRDAKLPRGLITHAQAKPFGRVRYHDAALNRRVDHALRGHAGYFVRTANLIKALRNAAGKARTTILSIRKRPKIELQEDQVRLITGKGIQAQLLLIAESCPDEVFRELGLPARSLPRAHLVVAGLDVPIPPNSRSGYTRLRGALHVVESPERTELGMFFAFNGVLHLRIISSSRASGTRAGELSQMLRDLQERDILPAKLSLGRARGALWYPPAGLALELEAHVAKRCLLIGTAGGFADTITGHTLLPSVKSALLGADAALAALKSPKVQERLMRFTNSWRKGLADYLRPPNTSLQMLLPLLFVNQNIVGRFTRALLYGENI
jgi:flavin-dependent dehydrogenase